MPSAASQPHLRLVRVDDSGAEPSWNDLQRARLEVVKENRIAAHVPGLDPNDPRWVLAMQTQSRLQGATLTPERRDQLLKLGTQLGMRPFESNLVIAIVQDRARAGLGVKESASVLKLVGEPANSASEAAKPASWLHWVAALAAAAVLAGLILRWLSGH